MFHQISLEIRERMAYLEALDARDRVDGTSHAKRLRQVPPEVGRFLALLAAGAPTGMVLETGTSAGYSALWLALACRQRDDRLVTFEYHEYKVRLARETFAKARVEDIVQLVHADARDNLQEYSQIAFCFLDGEKDSYQRIYDLVVPRLVRGGLLAADNVLSHKEELASFTKRALSDERLDALVVPIGKGVLLCRRGSSLP